MKDLGLCSTILGIELEQSPGCIHISQPNMIQWALEMHGMTDTPIKDMLLPQNIRLTKASDDDEKIEPREYQSV
ncbi:hypothetical protein IWW52_003213, partial [Coemansia sp. RSA 2704]